MLLYFSPQVADSYALLNLDFQEVRALVEILDVNGSGDLDVAEWRRFYNTRRISLSEFGALLFSRIIFSLISQLPFRVSHSSSQNVLCRLNVNCVNTN